MPHIRIRSLPDSAVASLSKQMPKSLSILMNTPEDNFTVEKVATQFYRDGQPVDGDPMIEVMWFDRGKAMRDDCAKAITEMVAKQNPADYIAVVFTGIAKTDYYENGKHF